MKILTNRTSANQLSTTNNFDPIQSNEILLTDACHHTFTETLARHASFATWPNKNSPPVDDLVRAGFFLYWYKNYSYLFLLQWIITRLGS